MNLDDVVFYGSLVTCMSLGNYYKMIEEPDKRRNYGAGLGLLISYLVCGYKFYHAIFMVWGNIIIIKCCDKRYVHVTSFAYTWIYLMYLYFNVNGTRYSCWFHKTLALRLVGLAFEICNANKSKTDGAKTTNPLNKTSNVADTDLITTEPTSVEIIAYAYFFVGIHRGPYYRWKIFKDHFNMPFEMLGDCRVVTEQKLKKVCAYCLGYWLLSLKYTSQMYYQDAFYNTHGTDFCYLYNIPLLFMYFLKWQIIMLLCTSVCTETSFGVYPTKSQPMPGHGPSVNVESLNLASGCSNTALDQEYNFSTLKCFDNEKLLIGPKMTDTLRGWDMPTRYWFWTYIHQSFLKQHKEARSATSFFAWMCWKGPSIPQVIMGITLWLFVRLETEYCELYDTSRNSMKIPWDIGFSIMRMFCLIYLTPCLFVEDAYTLFRYYNSIFWVYHFVLVVLILLSIILYKHKESND